MVVTGRGILGFKKPINFFGGKVHNCGVTKRLKIHNNGV